jgi:catechol 2,3-dioxygenase-like lactoylglutathione lyase family enzyme
MRRLLIAVALVFPFVQLTHAQLQPPNAMGITYGHVHLTVRDIEVHKKLWVEQFGGTVVQKGPLTTVKLPGMLIAFTQGKTPVEGSQGGVMDHFGFKVKDRAEFLKSWRAAGLEVQSEFTGAEGFPNAYIMAPDGVRVELQEDKALTVKASAYHLHYFAPDHPKLLQWYVDTFGAVSKKRGTHDAADVPGMNLTFNTSQKPRPGTRGRSIDHIGFEVANLAAFVKTLEAKGIKFDVPYRQIPSVGLNVAYLTDPAGTYIELTEGYAAY